MYVFLLIPETLRNVTKIMTEFHFTDSGFQCSGAVRVGSLSKLTGTPEKNRVIENLILKVCFSYSDR